MSRLNQAYREVLRKELSWLPDLIPADAENFQARLIDLDTLNLEPRSVGDPFVDKYIKLGSLLLIGQGGYPLGEVGVRMVSGTARRWSWKSFRFVYFGEMNKVIFRETVEEAIKRISHPHHIRYILQMDSEKYGGKNVVLHKLPKSADDFTSWLEVKKREAQDHLKDFLGK